MTTCSSRLKSPGLTSFHFLQVQSRPLPDSLTSLNYLSPMPSSPLNPCLSTAISQQNPQLVATNSTSQPTSSSALSRTRESSCSQVPSCPHLLQAFDHQEPRLFLILRSISLYPQPTIPNWQPLPPPISKSPPDLPSHPPPPPFFRSFQHLLSTSTRDRMESHSPLLRSSKQIDISRWEMMTIKLLYNRGQAGARESWSLDVTHFLPSHFSLFQFFFLLLR